MRRMEYDPVQGNVGDLIPGGRGTRKPLPDQSGLPGLPDTGAGLPPLKLPGGLIDRKPFPGEGIESASGGPFSDSGPFLDHGGTKPGQPGQPMQPMPLPEGIDIGQLIGRSSQQPPLYNTPAMPVGTAGAPGALGPPTGAAPTARDLVMQGLQRIFQSRGQR